MQPKIADNGSFAFFFEAEEVELGLSILESIVPANEESQQKLQDFMDLLLSTNNLHQYRTIN